MNAPLDHLLAATIRGDGPAAGQLAACDPEEVCIRADYHGVLPMVAERLSKVPQVPSELGSRVRLHAARQAATDLLQEAEIIVCLSALARSGVDALLLKGAHLAYAWYERSELRPRLDTDILIPFSSKAAVKKVLLSLGYEASANTGGDLVSYQAAFVKWRQGLRLHVLDVHWRVANPQVFAGLPTYDELMLDRTPVPRLGMQAFGLSAPPALLLACVHRVAHHFDSSRLIWLYDIHLLASALSQREWEIFLSLVEERKMAAVCRRSLDRTTARFHTRIPPTVRSDRRLCAPTGDEASAVYTKPRRRTVDNVATDLQVLESWRDRVRFVREHLFPPRRYMRDVYAVSSRTPLPLLYASRVVRGAWRWLDRAAAADDVPES